MAEGGDEDGGEVVVGHDLVDRVREDDQRVRMRQFGDRTRQRADGLDRETAHDILRIPIRRLLPYAKL